MKFTSMTSVSRSSVGSVLLAAGLMVGCGDDGGGNVVVEVDAGSDAAVTATSSAPDTSEGDTSEADTARSEPTSDGDSTRESSAASSTSTGATSEPGAATDTAVDAGSGEQSTDATGSVTEGISSLPVSTGPDVWTSTADESTVVAPCGDVGELCCAATEGNPRGTCNEGYQCNNPAGGGLSNSECIVPPLDAGVCGGEGEVCCATGGGFTGTCDEGYACDNPPGGGLTNSTCVVEADTDGSGGTSTGGATSTAETSVPADTSEPADTSAPVEASDASAGDAGETVSTDDAGVPADASVGQ